MFKRSREMYAPRSTPTPTPPTCKGLRAAALTFLILFALLLPATALKADRQRRRNALSAGQSAGIEEATEVGAMAPGTTIPDQLAVAASRGAPPGEAMNQQRRSGAYGRDAEGDFTYSNLELNLVRPENEQPLHTHISAKYTSGVRAAAAANAALDESETAEEYVSKAMQMAYGARLMEPIRIGGGPEGIPQPQRQKETAQANQQSDGNANNEFYNYAALSQQQQQQHEQQQQRMNIQQLSEQRRPEEESLDPVIDPKQFLQLKLQSQLPAQQQEAQQMAEPQQPQQQQAEKDPARSYEVYDENMSHEGAAAPQVERYYRTKYAYQSPKYRGVVGEAEAERDIQSEEKIRVSASTEIPKAEIMKQIEKSVIRYMKELEAEGKIITEPKSYYKMVTVPVAAEDKYVSSTTTRPKYTSSTSSYHGSYHGGSTSPAPVPRHRQQGQQQQHSSAKHHSHKPRYQTETAYQAGSSSGSSHHNHHAPSTHQEMSDALAPNVEFIYKIKTRAPLQTATVKTVSKPYTLPLKGTYDQFDHSAALKNMEEFDLSHVVTDEPNERPIALAGAGGDQPRKLYFNADVYEDINSLPYKGEQSRPQTAGGVEYRKVKTSDDYKGYSGYFAEPAPEDMGKEVPNGSGEDGYPIMNPYQYVLKKKPLHQSSSQQFDDDNASWEQTHSGSHGKPSLYAAISAQKTALEYDSYNPKYNNNPEGYGYQHAYKSHASANSEALHNAAGGGSHKYVAPSRQHSSGGGKRGKRGNGVQHANKKGGAGGVRILKNEMEASLALRPPPKVKA